MFHISLQAVVRSALLACGLGLVLAAASPLQAVAQDRTPLRVAVEGAFPPFNYLDANNKLQGFDIDIANALCEVGKFECQFIIEKWDDMIPDLIGNKYDAIISSMSMSLERRQKVAFTEKYYNSPSVFIVRKDSAISDVSPAALSDKKLGVTSSTAQESYAKHFYPEMKKTVFRSSPELYKGLADGSVDIILEDKLAIYDWIANTKAGTCCEFKGPDLLDVTYFGEGAGIAVRMDDDERLARLNAALKTIKEDGTYDMINAKYFPFSIQ
ncbi:transporter substrate-binding domain-containing protein [Rhizobium lentis]|uniref:transporter substrate-binding domain-containing protein n=1 Tax=Rhizobium lentis TaxID=1138194 RepID=UPI001A938C6B|nr:transporter substrate-binding domain-containing protein [Rhizobium lentis]MBX4999495.1 transporter substrate-binding domain-containing protein [Rhizobium lentis]MBX5011378.1 transporter substrate-binding domain-containing protein [Rhizobium lentis]MBX5015219.1 transporter substrate-binding domain-containing protein [Rhizobium lentis]MBX5066818.1 transporter substrate-binding domain-containing protein [Rhizobium lentis]MBX5078277.1 transporter substrate-binding domain-containing protein [Rhi